MSMTFYMGLAFIATGLGLCAFGPIGYGITFIFLGLMICFFAWGFMCVYVVNVEKKKEEEARARYAALRVAREQLPGATPPAKASPGENEFDIIYIETPFGETRQVGAARSETGKGVELEISEPEN